MSTPLSLQDRLELLELGARYAHAYDSGRSLDYAALFEPDGQFQRDSTEPIIGARALAEMVEAAQQRAQGYLHITCNPVLEPSATGATGTSYVVLLRVDGSSLHVLAAGVYEDEYTRSDEGWRFQARRFRSRSDPAVAGPLLMAAAAPR